MKINNPLISVITVVYNGAISLERTIQSVVGQTFSNLEYIIIDGSSNDGTLDIIKKYSNQINFLISEPDKGIYDAMNKGILAAKGEWINFMNVGDIFHSSSTIKDIFSKAIPNDKIVVYGDVCLVISKQKYFIPASPIDKIKKVIPFCHQSSFIKANYLKKYPYNLEYKIASDYDSFYNIYKYDNNAFYYIPLIIADYNSESGFSLKNNLACMKEHVKISNCNTTITSKIIFQIKYLRAYLKSFIPLKFKDYHRIRSIKKLYKEIN